MVKKLCTACHAEFVEDERVVLGYLTCMPCGEAQARKKKHTAVPLHKSNYIVPANREELKCLNKVARG